MRCGLARKSWLPSAWGWLLFGRIDSAALDGIYIKNYWFGEQEREGRAVRERVRDKGCVWSAVDLLYGIGGKCWMARGRDRVRVGVAQGLSGGRFPY